METLDVYALENGQEKVAIHNVSCQYPQKFMLCNLWPVITYILSSTGICRFSFAYVFSLFMKC